MTTFHELLQRLPSDAAGLVDRVVDPARRASQLTVVGARSLALASSSDVVFCKSVSPKLLADVAASAAEMIVTTSDVYAAIPEEDRRDRIFVLTARPRVVLSALTLPLVPVQRWQSGDPRRAPTVRIAPDAEVAPGVVIGEHVSIGARSVIGPNTVLSHVHIGDDTIIGANCSIGGQGFSFESDPETGAVMKVPHFGRVVIGSRVEVYSNVCIARGSFGDTIIDDDVKIDNLVHIAHNCHIQRGAFIIANAMIAGSVTVGEGAWIAPSTSVLNGSSLGRHAMTGLGAVVTKSVDDNTLVVGVPAKALRARYPSQTSSS